MSKVQNALNIKKTCSKINYLNLLVEKEQDLEEIIDIIRHNNKHKLLGTKVILG